MEQCIVCLKSNEDIFSRINIQSSEWNECNIQRIIEKHLWWWYLKPQQTHTTQWICRECWQELSSFHNFYRTIVQVHRQYQTMPVVNKLEIIKVKQESCGGGGANKNVRTSTSESNTNLHIEQLNIMDVKSEIHFEINVNEGDELLNYYNQCNDDVETSAKYLRDSIVDDIEPKDFLDLNIIDTENNDNEDNEILMSLITLKSKNKLRQKTSKKDKKPKLSKSKSSVRVKPTKVIKAKDKSSEIKLNTLVMNDEFFKESQHKLECSICNEQFAEFRQLKEHFRNDHEIRGFAKCCGKKFFKRCLLIDHINVHKNPEYFKCQHCSKLFSIRRCLESHLKTHTQRERTFRCEECGKSYFTNKVFERHLLSHVPDNERNFPCQQCDKKFASRYLLRTHEIQHSKKYNKICDICGKSYRDNFSFVRHMEEHNGATPSCETCPLCGIKLTNKYALTQHIKMRHNEENMQEQTCPYCSKVSPNINAHRKHIKYSHTMERKHACHMCDKSFRRPVELKEHLSTHTGEALYTCPHCPRTFISNANMHKHRKLAHRIEWEEGRLKKFDEPRRKRRVDTNIMLDSIDTTTMLSVV